MKKTIFKIFYFYRDSFLSFSVFAFNKAEALSQFYFLFNKNDVILYECTCRKEIIKIYEKVF